MVPEINVADPTTTDPTQSLLGSDPLNAILGYLGGFGQVGGQAWSAINSLQNQKWLRDAFTNYLNNARQQQGIGQGVFQGAAGPVQQYGSSGLGALASQLYGPGGANYVVGGNILNAATQGYGGNGIQGLYDQYGGVNGGMTPAMQGLMSQQGSLLQSLSGPGSAQDTANSVFQNGGWTPARQSIQDQATSLLNGGNSSQQGMQSLSAALMGSQGQNAFTSGLQNNALQVLSNGGYTPQLNSLTQAVAQGLQSNLGTTGLTQTGAQGEQTALGLLQSGGQTPWTNALQNMGVNQADASPVLSTPEALSIARNTASTQNAQAAETARRQALLRGGGPGSTTANGMQNQALADFADQSSRNVSTAVQQQLLTQQQLGLQSQQQGAQMALQAGSNANTALGTGASLLNSLEGTANQRYATGGGLIGSAAGLATGNVSANGGLGVQGGNLANGLLNTGVNASNEYINSLLGGGNLLNSSATNQGQYALGAGNLAQQYAQLQNSGYNSMYQNYLGSGALGNSNFNALAGQYNNVYGNQLGLLGQLGSQYGTNLSGLNTLAGTGANYAVGFRDQPATTANSPAFVWPAANQGTAPSGAPKAGSPGGNPVSPGNTGTKTSYPPLGGSPSGCGPGTTYNSDTKMCEGPSQNLPCPPNFSVDPASGNCVPNDDPGTTDCPPDYTKNSDGSCTKAVSTLNPCSPPDTLVDGKCTPPDNPDPGGGDGGGGGGGGGDDGGDGYARAMAALSGRIPVSQSYGNNAMATLSGAGPNSTAINGQPQGGGGNSADYSYLRSLGVQI
jgi:hypothetical protein